MYNEISVSILVNGNVCKQYHHEGKTFIEAKPGSEYEIHLQNNLFRRVMFVTSVDGLDVMTGESADPNAGGYIVESNRNVKIKGFRVSNSTVGAFKFTSREQSYAATSAEGDINNTGVIGVIAYYEKINPPPPRQYASWCGISGSASSGLNTLVNYERSFSNNPHGKGILYGNGPASVNYLSFTATSDASSNLSYTATKEAEFDMGTTWGQQKESKIIETTFERGSVAFSTNIYYASREQLIKMGVPLSNIPQVAFPNPFPAKKFATPPAGWP
jgi:hypothetical protein